MELKGMEDGAQLRVGLGKACRGSVSRQGDRREVMTIPDAEGSGNDGEYRGSRYSLPLKLAA